jgi:hypothetical protein
MAIFCEHDNEHLIFIKGGKFLHQLSVLVAQEGLSSVVVISGKLCISTQTLMQFSLKSVSNSDITLFFRRVCVIAERKIPVQQTVSDTT